MEGRRVVVTGATAGLGREIAAQLASRGAELVLACRDADRGRQVAEEVSANGGTAPARAMPVDMSSQESVRRFAQEYRRRYDRLDVLINNAGTLRPERQTSADGVELTFATNVIGYHLLTQELLDVLRGSAPARVVNVASTFAGEVELDDLQFERRRYDGMKAYAQSKACDRMLTWALARQLADSGVTANAMAPGLVTETELYRDVPDEIRDHLARQPSRSIADGAETAVWLASSPAVEGVSGRFYEQRAEQACAFRNADDEDRLWAHCEALTRS